MHGSWCTVPFQPPDNPENQNFKIEKNNWRYYNFTNFHNKWQSYDVWFLRYGMQQTKSVVILDHFLPFQPLKDPENQYFGKNEQNTWKYYHFTNVYHKWQSYDIWFLRYEVQQTKLFVILDHFFHLMIVMPTWNFFLPENLSYADEPFLWPLNFSWLEYFGINQYKIEDGRSDKWKNLMEDLISVDCETNLITYDCFPE